MKNLIVINKSHDPWLNLALEEYLLENVTEYENILFLWQNANTIVIGKNQNPWRECRTGLLESEDGKLARRSSGGGAVYHDMGNLNFSFIMDKDKQNFNTQAKIIIEAVKAFNIESYVNGRNDIVTTEGKFSGNAFTFRRNRALHHGTILLDVNREKLGRYLQVSKEKMAAKGIKSVQSRIVNLKEYNEAITIDSLRSSIKDAFIKEYGPASILDEFQEPECLNKIFDKKEIDRIYDIFSSWNYRYGEAPKFDIELTARFPWGGIEIHLCLKNGIVTQSRIFSDAIDEAFISDIQDCFNNIRFTKDDMAQAILEKREKVPMAQDIANFILSREF